MSKHRPEIDFNPLLRKVQNDISLLCYLGLHQYAKDNKLIGRSRPMIGPDIDFLMQKRLNFRLVVACIQQIIGSKTYRHGNREEQINYVNVGEYSVLRLYGLLDQEMFAVKTNEKSTLSSWWPEQFATGDKERLRSPTPIKAFREDLSYNTRACLEIGGEIFTNNLRNALKHIPLDLIDFKPHAQRDPRNRMTIKNIAVPLKLVEQKQFHQRHNYLARIPRDGVGPNTVFIPSHIEQLLHFRHVLWPWIQSLQRPDVKESFQYIANNFPSLHAVQMKIRSIRESTAERERRERLRVGEEARREANVEQLRERIVARYGEAEPQDDGPQIEHVPGYHGMELEAPGAAFDRRIEENQEERARVHATQDIHLGNGLVAPRIVIDEDEPYDTHVLANFENEDAEHPPPDTPEFGYVEQNGEVAVLPVPDVHHGTQIHTDLEQQNLTLAEDDQAEQFPLPPNNLEEIVEGVRERIARALNQPILPIGEEDDG